MRSDNLHLNTETMFSPTLAIMPLILLKVTMIMLGIMAIPDEEDVIMNTMSMTF